MILEKSGIRRTSKKERLSGILRHSFHELNQIGLLIIASQITLLPEGKDYDPIDVLGIDLGFENIAVDSDREIFDCKKNREY
jgi:hypothetical protein